jgi:integrase
MKGIVTDISGPQRRIIGVTFVPFPKQDGGLTMGATHTLRHKDCPVCQGALKLALALKGTATMGLFDAGNIWIAGKVAKRRLPKTIECCEGNLRHLKVFFGDMPLKQFTAGSFLAYRIAREKGLGVFEQNGPVGVSAINHELNVLQQILRTAGLWGPIKDFYAPMPEPAWKPPKTFTLKEEKDIFEAATADPNVELFEIVAKITRNTTASGCELRGLRLRHIDMSANPPRVHIPPDATKNDIRPRVIPLNSEAEEAFRKALDRAARLGSHRPEHYLFPFRINRKYYDPNKPASKSWLRKQTEKMRTATGIPHIRPHAFRHLAVTELLESGAPEQTVIAIAGWISRNMINTYSHSRIEAKADALRLLDKKPLASISTASRKIIMFPQK